MSRLRNASVYVLHSLICLTLILPAASEVRPDPTVAVLKCPDRVHVVAFSPDDRLLAAGIGWDTKGGVLVWDLASRKLVAELAGTAGEDSTVEAIDFSPDGKLLAMANWGGEISLWDTKTWHVVKTLARKQEKVQTLHFSPDSTRLLITKEEAVLLASVVTGQLNAVESKSKNVDEYVEGRFTRGGDQVVIADDRSIRLVDLKTKRTSRSWPTGNDFFGRMTDDGRYVIGGGGGVIGSKGLRTLDVTSNKATADLDQIRDGLFGLALSSDNKTIAFSGGGYGSGGYVSLWDAAAGRELGFVSYGDFPVERLAFSHDGKLLAAASESGAVVIYDPLKIRGGEVTEQKRTLCGEVVSKDGSTHVTAISMVRGLNNAWDLEITNPEQLPDNTRAIRLDRWAIESSLKGDRIRLEQSTRLNRMTPTLDSIVLAEVQNPGWNLGQIVKLYSDGSYIATDNPGNCVAVGNLRQVTTTFDTVKDRLLHNGFLDLAKEPLTPETPHYFVRYITMSVNGSTEIRSSADEVQKLLDNAAVKRDRFDKFYEAESPLLKQLVPEAAVKH